MLVRPAMVERALDPESKEIIDQDVYTTAVLSGNRNFDGRIHLCKAGIFGISAFSCCYALAGSIRFDIESGVLGEDINGVPIFLSDLWPTDEEIDAIVNSMYDLINLIRSTLRCLS